MRAGLMNTREGAWTDISFVDSIGVSNVEIEIRLLFQAGAFLPHGGRRESPALTWPRRDLKVTQNGR